MCNSNNSEDSEGFSSTPKVGCFSEVFAIYTKPTNILFVVLVDIIRLIRRLCNAFFMPGSCLSDSIQVQSVMS